MPEGKKRTKKSAPKKTKVVKKKTVAQAALAVPTVAVKKTTTTKKRPAKKTVRKSKRKVVRKTVTVPVDISPITPPQLPTPIEVTPLDQGKVKSRHSKHSMHNWPFHHHLFGMLAVAMSAIIAVVTIYQYTEATLITIAAYDGFSSALTQPTESVAQIFTTDAGELTMTYPETWSLTNTATDNLQFQSTQDTNATIELSIKPNDTDNVFSWLTKNQPSYTNAKVIEPTNGVKALGGILMTANDTDGHAIQVVYFPIQTDLAHKFIVALTLTYPTDSTWAERLTKDYGSIVNQVRFNVTE